MSDDSPSERFAFFDLDLTLIVYDSQLLFCNHVLRKEWWRRGYLLFFAPCLVLYALKILGDRQLKRVFLSFLWRMRRERLEEHVSSFVEEVLPQVRFDEVVAEIAEQREAGRRVVLNSASPGFYAKAIAERLGFEECYGTEVEIGERMALFPRFVGKNNKGSVKIEAMREILPREAPIPDSFAFSDSSADLPLLELAEHPVMVHPSKGLRAVGEERGWPTRTPKRPYDDNRGRNLAYGLMALGLWRPER